MRLLANLNSRLIRLTGYAFSSNYRAEQALIESIYHRYAEYIDSHTPSRYFWRSRCQYRCQSFYRSKLTNLLANLGALLVLPLIMLLIRKNKRREQVRCKYLKVDFHMAYQVPMCIRSQTVESSISFKYLSFGDFIFAITIFTRNRYFCPELLLKFLLWIGSVRPHLDSYQPEYLIQYCEYSAYSSLRKSFLNKEGILLTNVAHGEEVISCRSAFSTFDQYFAWEVTPRSIHDAMHIECGERYTFNPCEGLSPAPKDLPIPVFGVLWPTSADVDIEALVLQLNAISNFCEVVVRPHPNANYSNRFGDYQRLLKANVSNAQTEDIHSFVDRCSVVVGTLSAALLLAAFRGREVVYLHDGYLASLRTYHEYYQKINFVTIDGLAKCFAERLKPRKCESSHQ